MKISNKVDPVVDCVENSGGIPLAKYLAHAGVCSRRAAQSLVRAGSVTVNGVIEQQPHRRVIDTDRVMCEGIGVKSRRINGPLYYYLLNKPAGFLCTANDPEGRQTIFDLVPHVGRERLYNVGRLDCNSTGLILITNDGELTHQLTHPKYGIEKTYHVQLHRPLSEADALLIRKGIRLDDGFCSVKDVAFTHKDDMRYVQIVLSSGKNRIIRRLFQELGYFIKRLDRVKFGHLSKKGISLGCWRCLTASEVTRFKKQK